MRNGLLANVLLGLTLVWLLSSCSHFSKNDGPPRFYVDETRIPDAVPKAEPLSKYGNYKSYVVFGKRYHTLTTSKDFEQVGTASWYGTKFHDRKTSSGEPYDMLKMTAAHKTLPLPTYVEVTNLNNHKRIIVKVNDRGPFASDRIIDLSYVAAKKLGMIGHGTTRVRLKAIDPNDFNTGKPPLFSRWLASNPPTNHYLQVGVFKNRSNAQRLKTRVNALIRTPVIIHRGATGHSLYYVKVGPFTDVALLSQTSKQLQKLGIPNKSTA